MRNLKEDIVCQLKQRDRAGCSTVQPHGGGGKNDNIHLNLPMNF